MWFLDFGTSYVKGVFLSKKKITRTIIIPSDIKLDFPIKAATGKVPNHIKIKKKDEIQSIAKGTKAVTKLNNCVIVNMGTGTTLISLKNKTAKHIGGTSVGGGTLVGLSTLILRISRFSEIEKLARKGDLSKTDILLKDIYPKGIGMLSSRSTLSHFGKLKNPSKDDLALAIFNLVGQTVTNIAYQASKAEKTKNIVFIGLLSTSPIIQSIIKKRISILDNKTRTIFPNLAPLVAAIGTSL